MWALLVVLFVCCIYLYLIKPNRRRAEAAFFAKQMYAHRGLHDDENGIPENSLPAFKHAMEKGYGVELDVQLTADNVPVVFHDENLLRMCGVDKNVREVTCQELKEYRLKNSEERIPLLTEVLELLGQTPILCEIKTYPNKNLAVCAAVADTLKKHNCSVCIESFNPLAVRYFKKHMPEIVRGQLSMDFSKSDAGISPLTKVLLQNLLFDFYAKPDFIAFQHTDKKCFSFSLCRKLYQPFCFAWTVISPAEAEKAKPYFDTVIFERYLP